MRRISAIGAYKVPMTNLHLDARLEEKLAMAKPIKLVLLLTLLLPLNGCAAPVGVTVWGDVLAGAIGDAIDPLVQPQVDRLLVKAHIANVDPGGTSAVAPQSSQS
jgi:hypothetical protein